ncbi:MAG: PP2C family serine/threonine-protein phosphatase [Microcoleaceae cyanobacterium]
MALIESNWQIISASVIGKGHEKRNLPCQDAHAWEILSPDTLVIAVADGAGSAKLSAIGAQVAVQTAIEVVTKTQMATTPEQSWEESLKETLFMAQKAVFEEASRLEAEIRDLATTLIVVVATPGQIAVAQVGDGAAVVATEEKMLHALTLPEQGEYLNETKFLICADAVETAQINIWQGTATHLAVFSDGLQMLGLKMPDGTPHQPFFSPLFEFVANADDEMMAKEQLVSFLRSPRVSQRTDDDLTLVLAALYQS